MGSASACRRFSALSRPDSVAPVDVWHISFLYLGCRARPMSSPNSLEPPLPTTLKALSTVPRVPNVSPAPPRRCMEVPICGRGSFWRSDAGTCPGRGHVPETCPQWIPIWTRRSVASIPWTRQRASNSNSLTLRYRFSRPTLWLFSTPIFSSAPRYSAAVFRSAMPTSTRNCPLVYG